MFQTIIYFVLAFLVALLGIGKRGGFLLHLVVAVALTPVAGIIMALIASETKSPAKAVKVKAVE
jgi:hypothetical protein